MNIFGIGIPLKCIGASSRTKKLIVYAVIFNPNEVGVIDVFDIKLLISITPVGRILMTNFYGFYQPPATNECIFLQFNCGRPFSGCATHLNCYEGKDCNKIIIPAFHNV